MYLLSAAFIGCCAGMLGFPLMQELVLGGYFVLLIGVLSLTDRGVE
jgi:hypothetical protein